MKLTKQEKSWVLQDWGNSVYSIMITTAILPIYF
ncbi:bile tolerance locus A [Listeria riparia FSL S10-1204]|nr:bile tolerance locus A [Listeria riparia FSL S10-1204]